MKLHIGCGKKHLPGFKHLDIMKYDHIDYVANADKLDMFEDNTIAEIYACHVLEHFNRNEVKKVIFEWNRALRPDGIIRIAVPDFDAIVEEYNQNRDVNKILGLLYGGQDYEYNFHHIVFSLDSISKVLVECGFKDISRYNWQDFLPDGYDDFSRAYIPHMDFHGRLMSLNVIAKKKSLC